MSSFHTRGKFFETQGGLNNGTKADESPGPPQRKLRVGRKKIGKFGAEETTTTSGENHNFQSPPIQRRAQAPGGEDEGERSLQSRSKNFKGEERSSLSVMAVKKGGRFYP